MTKIYLASKSPRRSELLRLLGFDFEVLVRDVDETLLCNELPLQAGLRLSRLKADAVKDEVNNGVIIAADTLVVSGDEILGKPVDAEHARAMLTFLSGKTHKVITAYCLENADTGVVVSDYEKTEVTFRELSAEEINEYIKTGSPFDKAGGYGIQDSFGARFVSKINGCYYNVMGLPISKIYYQLQSLLQTNLN